MNSLRSREAEDGTTNKPLGLDNIAEHMAIAAFIGVSWYNIVELNVLIYMSFKRKQGLYFWSMVLSTYGILLHSLGVVLKLYGVIQSYQVTISIITVGWYLMIMGQSIVLYSRLHLMVRQNRIIRAVLVMIIWHAITLHIPTTVLTYGANSHSPQYFLRGYRIMEKIQMTLFCIQELIISIIYMWATVRFLKPSYKQHIHSVMIQLVMVNVILILMDIAMLTVEYMGYYSLEVAMKGAIYSVKLKIEIAVLNQLVMWRLVVAGLDGLTASMRCRSPTANWGWI